MKRSKLIAREKQAATLSILETCPIIRDLVNLMLKGVPVFECEGNSFSELNRQGFESFYQTYGAEVFDFDCISNYIPDLIKQMPTSEHIYHIYQGDSAYHVWVVGAENAKRVCKETVQMFCELEPFWESEYREKRELESMICRMQTGEFKSHFTLADLMGRLAEVKDCIKTKKKDRLNYYIRTVVIDKLT